MLIRHTQSRPIMWLLVVFYLGFVASSQKFQGDRYLDTRGGESPARELWLGRLTDQ